jgi:patatin-related protein
MHGVTKELHKLVIASRAFDADPNANPFGADDSSAAYFDALADLAAQGRSVSVSIDVVAGTSAGGINGVCLAKVLARNGSQEALKSLWIKEGDFKSLLKAPAIGGWRTRAALAALRVLPRLSKDVAPLRGDLMSQLLYDAIAAMDAPMPSAPSLLHGDSSLDLYVTTTDLYGSSVRVATGTGGVAQRETDHAQVMHFRADSSRNDFGGPESTAPLAFAARATSCFPGAFQPAVAWTCPHRSSTRTFQTILVALVALRSWHACTGGRTAGASGSY